LLLAGAEMRANRRPLGRPARQFDELALRSSGAVDSGPIANLRHRGKLWLWLESWRDARRRSRAPMTRGLNSTPPAWTPAGLRSISTQRSRSWNRSGATCRASTEETDLGVLTAVAAVCGRG